MPFIDCKLSCLSSTYNYYVKISNTQKNIIKPKHTHLVRYILRQNSVIDPNRFVRSQIPVSFDPMMSDYLQDLMRNLNPLANHFVADADADAVAVYPDERMVLHFVT